MSYQEQSSEELSVEDDVEIHTGESHMHCLMRQGMLEGIQEMYGWALERKKKKRLLRGEGKDEITQGDIDTANREFINKQEGISGETLAMIAVKRGDLEALKWLVLHGADLSLMDYGNFTVRTWSKHPDGCPKDVIDFLDAIDNKKRNREMRRVWSRVFFIVTGSEGEDISQRQLQKFFVMFPGLRRLVGGLILRNYNGVKVEPDIDAEAQSEQSAVEGDAQSKEPSPHDLMRKGQLSMIQQMYAARVLESSGDLGKVKRIFINDQEEKGGETLVLIAAEERNLQALEWLIMHGADLSIEDDLGYTVQAWAEHYDSPELLDCLSRIEEEKRRALVRRAWARVFIGAKAGSQLSGAIGNLQQLQYFFSIYPGLARRIGGLMLRHSRAPISDVADPYAGQVSTIGSPC